MTPVREFHIASGQPVADFPTPPSDATLRLRLRLIKEEFREVEHELELLLGANRADASVDTKLAIMADLLKELCDLRYVVEGTAVSLGLPIDEAYAHVHESNMTKCWPGEALMRKDEGGKVQRGPDYRPADMSKFVSVVDAEEEA